jgi:hypothetical protein
MRMFKGVPVGSVTVQIGAPPQARAAPVMVMNGRTARAKRMHMKGFFAISRPGDQA